MSYWSRIVNVFRGARLARDIDEELEAHIADAIEQGRDPEEARRAFGPALQIRERSQDVRLATRLDALRADVVFGWRQLRKNTVTSVAAVVSLALAMGACLSVFRLLDAMVLRPLPIAHASRLSVLTYPRMDAAGHIQVTESFDYPQFRALRAAVRGDAELLAVSPPGLSDLTFGTDKQTEQLRVQFVSGSMFDTFGLKPAVGRLLAATDDVTPGANAVAVLSWKAWTRRFGGDPGIVGRRFRFRDASYEIVGVSEERFTGTEPGWMTDIFVPTMMNEQAINQQNWAWFRIFAHLAPGSSPDMVRQKLEAAVRADRLERVKAQQWARARYEHYLAAELFLEPAAAGVSGVQRQYRRPLAVLALVVALVLLIACVNVANLMAGRAQARAREMALRVSIGAGRSRLIQLVLIESAMIGGLACGLGSVFAGWAAPFILGQINPPFAPPVQLALTYDWRVSAFSAALVFIATLSFGGIPAMRASAVRPAAALRGGAERLHRRSMNILIGAQVGFCVLVLFVAGLFAVSFRHLIDQPLGFDADGLVNLVATTTHDAPLADWEEVRRTLQQLPGVTSVAMATWPLLFGPVWSEPITIDGQTLLSEEAHFLATSPDWLRTLRIPLLSGRELQDGDPFPGPVLVNQSFARQYFEGRDPVGRSFRTKVAGKAMTCTIVGVVGDARYVNVRDAMRSAVYVPFTTPHPVSPRSGTFVVRTAMSGTTTLLATLRQRVSQTRPSFRVTEVYAQKELVDQHTIRERLLAMMAMFFAVVAVALSTIGLYGVLSYSVMQRRREIGIRIALGAPGGAVAWAAVSGVVAVLVPGAVAGLGGGVVCQRYFDSLLFQVKPFDPSIIALSLVVTVTIALSAALPAITRALRIDALAMLRAE